jgi:protein-S-isoprenylcysteine O-methyltransferase Ste14
MVSLLLRNLFFTILQPGIIAGLIPFLIVRDNVNNLFAQPFTYQHDLGAILFIIGFVIMLTCILGFAVNGQGTLSPVDPTKRLVTTGLYQFSRNPMYAGVTLMLIGEAIFFQSNYVWIYLLLVFTAFNIFIFFNEEPRLRKDFGEEYIQYCKNVRRWI